MAIPPSTKLLGIHAMYVMKLNLKFWKWDFFHFSKAAIVFTIYAYFAQVIAYDVLNYPAWWGFILTIPLGWAIKYYAYEKFWRYKKNDNQPKT